MFVAEYSENNKGSDGKYNLSLEHADTFVDPIGDHINMPQDSQLLGATAYVPVGHVLAVKSQLDAPEAEYDPALQVVQLADATKEE